MMASNLCKFDNFQTLFYDLEVLKFLAREVRYRNHIFLCSVPIFSKSFRFFYVFVWCNIPISCENVLTFLVSIFLLLRDERNRRECASYAYMVLHEERKGGGRLLIYWAVLADISCIKAPRLCFLVCFFLLER